MRFSAQKQLSPSWLATDLAYGRDTISPSGRFCYIAMNNGVFLRGSFRPRRATGKNALHPYFIRDPADLKIKLLPGDNLVLGYRATPNGDLQKRGRCSRTPPKKMCLTALRKTWQMNGRRGATPVKPSHNSFNGEPKTTDGK